MVFKLLREVLFSRPHTRIFILISSLIATFFGLAGPYFQKEFIDSLSLTSHSLPLVFASFVCIFLSLGFSQLTSFLGAREAILMQSQLAQKLYLKALRLRSDTLGGRPIGEIVAVYAIDIPGATVFLDQSVPTGASILFPLIFAPLFIGFLFEISLVPTLFLMMVIIILNFSMAYRQSKFFFNFKKLAADRIGLVSEWVQNIRTLRILGWVRQFESKIFLTREVETENRIAMVTNGQFMNSVASSITFILNIVVILSMISAFGEKVTSGSLMALLWIVAVFLTRPFRQMPWFFTFLFDSWTSLKRLDDFLCLENKDPILRNDEFQKMKGAGENEPALIIKNLNLNLNDSEILKSIDLEIKKGEFVAIVGEVGAGKSLLLLSLMGETGAEFDQYYLDGNEAKAMPLNQLRQFFSFVPQEGFIMSATLRENVTFEYETSNSHDKNILTSLARSQFASDLESTPDGLDTEIGERGVNLSGGQRQRVSLARVDYSQAPFILMDDCLSAVDVETENRLIDSLLKGEWKNRTRILVTHRLTVLDEVDRVIFMDNGKIIAQGSFKQLLRTNKKFRQFTATVAQEADKVAEIIDPESFVNMDPLKGSGNEEL